MLSVLEVLTFPEILNLIAIGVIGDAESFEDRIAKIDIVLGRYGQSIWASSLKATLCSETAVNSRRRPKRIYDQAALAFEL